MGSVTEGTKICVGNEVDFVVSFDGWGKEQPAFCIRENNPFFLYWATEACPPWMAEYLGDDGRFLFRKFKLHFLDSVQTAVTAVMGRKKKPFRLEMAGCCIGEGATCKGKISDGFYQNCDNCIFTVVQTKIGLCVQLIWNGNVYCSIDLAPTFNVPPVKPLDLARMVNNGMLREPRPLNWYR